MFTITHPNCLPFTTTSCKTKQAACRKAFKYWITTKQLTKQPKSSPNWESSFEGVTVV